MTDFDEDLKSDLKEHRERKRQKLVSRRSRNIELIKSLGLTYKSVPKPEWLSKTKAKTISEVRVFRGEVSLGIYDLKSSLLNKKDFDG